MSHDDGLSDTEVRIAFTQVNELLAGKPLKVAIAALQDLLAGTICFASDDVKSAKRFCRDIHRDLQKTIDKNFEHYNDPANARDVPPNRHH
jgi:hypothetical protein